MPRPEKVRLVAELAERLGRAQLAVITDFRGVKAGEMVRLRRELRAVQAEYKVAKNTLLRWAAQAQGQEAMGPLLVGPTGVVFCYDDLAAPVRLLGEFARSTRLLTIRGAVLDNQLLTPQQVAELASLPPRAVLQAELVGNIQGVLAGFVGLLNAALGEFVRTLDARLAQQSGAEAAA